MCPFSGGFVFYQADRDAGERNAGWFFSSIFSNISQNLTLHKIFCMLVFAFSGHHCLSWPHHCNKAEGNARQIWIQWEKNNDEDIIMKVVAGWKVPLNTYPLSESLELGSTERVQLNSFYFLTNERKQNVSRSGSFLCCHQSIKIVFFWWQDTYKLFVSGQNPFVYSSFCVKHCKNLQNLEVGSAKSSRSFTL